MKPDIDWLLDKLDRGHWDQDADDYEAVLLYAKKLEAAESEVASRARREAFEEVRRLYVTSGFNDSFARWVRDRAAEEGKG